MGDKLFLERPKFPEGEATSNWIVGPPDKVGNYQSTEECPSWEDDCSWSPRYSYPNLYIRGRNCEDPLREDAAYQSYCFMICLDMGDESYEECDRAWDRFYWCKELITSNELKRLSNGEGLCGGL